MKNILQKAAMTCSRFRKILLKNKTQPQKVAYEKQGTTALIFFMKKKIFFEKLGTKDITVKSPGE